MKWRELLRVLESETSAELSRFLKRVFGFSLEVLQDLDTVKDSNKENDPFQNKKNKDNDTSLGDYALRSGNASSGYGLRTQNDECKRFSSQTSKPELFQRKIEVLCEGSPLVRDQGTSAKKEPAVEKSVLPTDSSSSFVCPVMKKSSDEQDGLEDSRKTQQLLGMEVKSARIESGQTIWYFDGDPSSMDVYPASNQLWISSLGRDASDSVVRLQFEDFGPVKHFHFFGAQDFAVIEFRNIMDAVRAREFMGGSSPWGSCLRVKFMDPGLGIKGSFRGMAIGDSSHVFIGKIPNNQSKEELIQGLIASGLNGPRAVTDIVSESALILEFLTAEQAALAMYHIRKRRRESGSFNSSVKDSDDSFSQLTVKHVDSCIPEEELISAFSMYGEIVKWKLDQQSGICFMDFRSFEASDLAKSRLNGVRFGSMQLSVEFAKSSLVSLPSTSNVPNSFVNDYIISQLSSLFSSISSRYGINESSIFHHTPTEDEDQVASNTLLISFVDIVSPSFDEELKDFCNLAAGNAGSVVTLTRLNVQKPGWVVEFNSVDGAVAALKNIQNSPGVFFHVTFRFVLSFCLVISIIVYYVKNLVIDFLRKTLNENI